MTNKCTFLLLLMLRGADGLATPDLGGENRRGEKWEEPSCKVVLSGSKGRIGWRERGKKVKILMPMNAIMLIAIK